MKYSDFLRLGYQPRRSDLICIFRIEPTKGFSIKEAASRVASESSNGTWSVLNPPAHIAKLSAKVYKISGDYVWVAYPVELFEPGNMSQILSSIAGNVFGMKAVDGLRLEEVRWPKKIVKSFPGPRFGVGGIRKILKVKKRPIACTVPKPKVGYYSSEHAKVAFDAWTGGVDLVKDDENLTNQSFNKFENRVRLCMKMREKAEKITGERKACLLNITSDVFTMKKRAKIISDYGNEFAMVDILTAGWGAVPCVREFCGDLKLAIHGHRAFHAAFDRNPHHGMTMDILVEIARLQGVDSLHVGALGKLEGSEETVRENFEKAEFSHIKGKKLILEQDFYRKKPVMAACSGGLHPGIIGRLFDLLGYDMIIQLGGGIHGHPDGTHCGAVALRQAIDAHMSGIGLKEYSKGKMELTRALERWGNKTPK